MKWRARATFSRGRGPLAAENAKIPRETLNVPPPDEAPRGFRFVACHASADMADVPTKIPKTGFVVAIDGPAGAGKSTLARALAHRLRLPYVNTGLMYRALAARALEAGIGLENGPALAEITGAFRFSLRPGRGGVELAIDGRAPAPYLTSSEVEAVVSGVSSHPPVRAVMRAEQRRLGAVGCVMEGRDIGSVVFPDADVKIFLSALPKERARRRSRERGPTRIADAVARRDALDSRTNPLEPAPDAVVLDTTRLSPKRVLARALELVESTDPGTKRAGW